MLFQSVYYSRKSGEFKFYKQSLYLYQQRYGSTERKDKVYRMIQDGWIIKTITGTRNVYKRLIENLDNELKETIGKG